MAYSAVPTATIGQLWTDTSFNAYLRDNFAAGFPGLIAAKGDIVIATGADAADKLSVGADGYFLGGASSASVGWSWKPIDSVVARSCKSSTMATDSTYGIIDYESVDFDTGNRITTGENWKYTVGAGEAGYYFVDALVTTETYGTAGAPVISLGIFVSDTGIVYRKNECGQVDSTKQFRQQSFVSGMVCLSSGEYIDIRAYSSYGGATNYYIASDTAASYVQIVKVL